jgi:hypothetical protein
MTLEEQLTEKEEIKALILNGVKNDISSGSLLGYTTNSTKVVYEGSTKTYNLLNRLNAEIATIKANIYRLNKTLPFYAEVL